MQTSTKFHSVLGTVVLALLCTLSFIHYFWYSYLHIIYITQSLLSDITVIKDRPFVFNMVII